MAALMHKRCVSGAYGFIAELIPLLLASCLAAQCCC
jgi:hypothetical protein